MRSIAALVLLACSSPSARALAEPAASTVAESAAPSSAVHIGVSDGGEYIVLVSHDGQPSTLWTRVGAELTELRLRFVGANLHCTVKRSGPHPFDFDGDVAQSYGRAVTVGRFPADKGVVELKVRVTNGFSG